MNRPSHRVETELIRAMLCGEYAPGSPLPAERELAAQFKVTRPTVREALQRLARDGWLTLKSRQPTLVNDIWRDGNLNMLSALGEGQANPPRELVDELLEVRALLAPDYARLAVLRDPIAVVTALTPCARLGDNPQAFADNDWTLHQTMACASGNRIYPLMLNSFAGLYRQMGFPYFSGSTCRDASRNYYRELLRAAANEQPGVAAELTREAMAESLTLWRQLQTQPAGEL